MSVLTSLKGLVISHLGQGLLIEDEAGAIRLCSGRRQLGPIAVGDRVKISPQGEDQGRVEEIYSRKTLLTRPAHGGKIRAVAANLDQILVVIAPEPEPDWLLVDQYTAVAAHRNLKCILVANKMDQGEIEKGIQTTLSVYQAIGYDCLGVSARTGAGLAPLRQLLEGKTSMFSGQSGVGKSSLTNLLLPDRALKTNELSLKAGLGRHTTTSATLFHLPEGGDLIDSPGVSVFGLAEMNQEQLASGYLDFRSYLPHCRFSNCRHKDDLGCAVKAAVVEGHIHPQRYQRFHKLIDKMRLI